MARLCIGPVHYSRASEFLLAIVIGDRENALARTNGKPIAFSATECSWSQRPEHRDPAIALRYALRHQGAAC
jgi:hypothetical protein